MKEKTVSLIAFAGVLIGLILMFISLSSQLSDIQEELVINQIGERNTTCVPTTSNGKTIFECSHPSYYDLKEYLETNR